VELGRGSAQCWADAEKTARDPFLTFKFLFLLISQADGNNNWKKYLGIKEKCEILHGGRFKYLPQLLYWAL
jgi:hypothetical protein